tara:strand:+ start:9632 stop:10282 length:651 start_codon:yes stop_codon:yes gene_type:complete
MMEAASLLDFSDFFEQLAAEHTEDPCDGFGLAHVKRVGDLARKIQEQHGGDWAVIQAGALLHHVGGAHETAAAGLEVAERVLQLFENTQYDDSFANEVASCIENMTLAQHSQVKTREAQVLWDANQLEWLGMIGLSRLFARAGRLGTSLFGVDASIAPLNDPIEPNPSSVQNMVFYVMSRLPDKMFTETGREMAHQRYEIMEAFFARAQAESFTQR